MIPTEAATPMSIQRFALQRTAAQSVAMPEGAHIVNIRMLGEPATTVITDISGPVTMPGTEKLFMWAIASADAPKVQRVFYMYKSGEVLSRPPTGTMLINVGSVPTRDGTDLEHVFELIDEPKRWPTGSSQPNP